MDQRGEEEEIARAETGSRTSERRRGAAGSRGEEEERDREEGERSRDGPQIEEEGLQNARIAG